MTALPPAAGAVPALEMRGIVKRFPGVVANDGIDLTLRAGEVHALLGENGAGKSTLMSILAGLYLPDEGHLVVGGRAVRLRSPRDAIAQGIGMVHQHFMLVRHRTVAENVILGAPASPFFLDMSRMEREVAALAQRFALDVDPSAAVWQLSVGEQQRVEILKVLYRGARILILDEPTAVLTPHESTQLFATLRTLVRAGYSVVHISHKLGEVLQVADRITVLRRGRVVAAGLAPADTTREALAELVIGRPVPRSLEKGPAQVRERVLEVHALHALNDRGLAALRGISLGINAGEIYGLAGVAGNGQRELTEVITGLRPPVSGRITILGSDLTGCSVAKILAHGVAYVPEDRVAMASLPRLSVAENLILKSHRAPRLGSRWFLNRAAVRREVEALSAAFGIAPAALATLAGTLSGGNLQRVILAREFSSHPRLLLAMYPTRGLDMAATEVVHRLLLRAREEGTATLLISEDLDELLCLSDRLGVMVCGQITGERITAEASVQEIGLLMGGCPAEGGV